MKSNFRKHSQQHLYVRSKASKWLSPSLEMGVLPPGKPFHPESRVCWAEQGLLWAVLAAMAILAGSVCLSPAGGCSRAGWAPRVPAAGSGSVGDTRVVPARASAGLDTHAVHTRSCAVLCPWLRVVIVPEFASVNPQQWSMKKAVLYSACTCCLMLYGVILDCGLPCNTVFWNLDASERGANNVCAKTSSFS